MIIDKMIKFVFVFIILVIIHALFIPVTIAENNDEIEKSKRMESIIKTHIQILKKWAQDPIVVSSVKMQNEKNMSIAEIRRIDEQWTAGLNRNFALSLQKNSAGIFLKNKLSETKMSALLYVEAFLCDFQGAVVGQYPKTTDYWQGDEEKFYKCYNNGNGKIFVGPVTNDESTKTYSVQISLPVNEKDKTIGVLVVGLKNI